MPETTPLIKAALNLRGGAGFDVYGSPGKPGDSYSIPGDCDVNNRDGGIGRNWLEGLIRIQNTSL